MPETYTSLRQLVEAKYDAQAETMTLDGDSFGDQVTNLLAILNMAEIDLSAAKLVPPPETTPVPETWSLAGTATVWGTQACPVQITVAAGEAGVASVTATGTVASISVATLAQYVLPLDPDSAAALASMVLTGGQFTAAQPDGTLGFRATIADGWSPFGLDGASLASVDFGLAVAVDPDWGQGQTVMLTANLELESGPSMPVEIDVPIGGGTWSVGIVPPGITVNFLSDIALLVGNDYAVALPEQLTKMAALQIRSLILQFDPAGPSWSGIDIDLGTANAWPIAGNVQVEGIGLSLRVRPGSTPMASGVVTGTFEVAPFEFQVTIPVPLAGNIQLSGRSKQPLPGFGALASLIDAPFANSLPDGIANLGSLQIDNLSLAYDLTANNISALGMSIESSGAWTLIPSYLELDNLQFGITAQSHAAGWNIQGTASGTILVCGIQVGIAVDGGQGAWQVSVTEPIVLPGIDDIASLVGGNDSKTSLPDGFGDGIGALTITNYEMTFAGEANTLQNLRLGFQTTNAWNFWAPYFVLESMVVTLAVQGPTGARTFAASIAGVLEVAGVDIVLKADKPATSAGWIFSGGLAPDQEVAVGDFVAYLLQKFGVAAPAAIHSFVLDELAVTFETDTKAFTFQAGGQFEIAGQSSSLAISFSVNPQAQSGFTLDVQGDIFVGPAHFLLTFDQTPGSAVLHAQWNQANEPVGFADIAGAFGFVAPDIPESLDLTLSGAGFSYDFDAGRLVMDAQSKNFGQLSFVSELLDQQRMYLFDVDIPLDVHLSDLPVAGAEIPSALDAGIQQLEVAYTTAALGAADVAAINGELAAIQAQTIGASTLSAGMSLFATLSLGADRFPLSLALSEAPPAESGGARELTAAPGGYGGQAKWFPVGKSLGPVSLQRIGMEYTNSRLSFLLDAQLSFSILSLGLGGLGLGSPITRFQPVAQLDGLSVAVSSGPVAIQGGLLRAADDPANGITENWMGEVAIALSPYLISGMAGYAKANGQPSFFVFAQVQGDFGGPPAFFVTGFMGGFGYHSKLTLPAPTAVYQFPFIAGLDDPTVFGSGTPSPADVLNVLSGSGGKTAWVTPTLGEDWSAAGITFRSFELVLGRVLLVANFGSDFELALLGLASMSLPQGETVEAYAFVELQMEAVFRPQQGTFAVAASLTPNSFLFTQACHLTGGFAFCLWFGSPAADPHTGDFVVAIGGYHPAFTPPAWYPQPAPVGFNWPVDGSVTVKGGAYFALTPSAVMAGGNLEVLFQSGKLRAWFTAYANLLVRWKPFSFTASIGISVGASYKLKLLFTTKTVSVELGATLSLWGPPTGGTVSVHWYIISFTVSFGASPQAGGDLTLQWSDFKALLPGGQGQSTAQCASTGAGGAGLRDATPGQSVVSLNIVGGLARQDSGGIWIVRADELSFTAQSAIPSTSLYAGTNAVQTTTTLVNIRPMGATAVTSVLTATVTDSQGGAVALGDWVLTAQTSNLPEALWGAPLAATQAPSPAATLIPGLLSGLVFSAPDAQAGSGVGPFSLENLVDDLGDGYLALTPATQADPLPAPVASTQAIETIMATLARDPALGNEANLLSALARMGVAPPTTVAQSRLAQAAGSLFTQSPMLLPLDS